jgi:hypothetical protein
MCVVVQLGDLCGVVFGNSFLGFNMSLSTVSLGREGSDVTIAGSGKELLYTVCI